MFDGNLDMAFFDVKTSDDANRHAKSSAAADLITSDRNLLLNVDKNPMVHDRNYLARDYDALLRHAK